MDKQAYYMYKQAGFGQYIWNPIKNTASSWYNKIKSSPTLKGIGIGALGGLGLGAMGAFAPLSIPAAMAVGTLSGGLYGGATGNAYGRIKNMFGFGNKPTVKASSYNKLHNYLKCKLAEYNSSTGLPGSIPTGQGSVTPEPTTEQRYFRPNTRFGNEIAPLPTEFDPQGNPVYYRQYDPQNEYSPDHYHNVHYRTDPAGNINPKFENRPGDPKYTAEGIIWNGAVIPDAATNAYMSANNPNTSAFQQWLHPYHAVDINGKPNPLPAGVTPRMIAKWNMDRANRPFTHEPGTFGHLLESAARGWEYNSTKMPGMSYSTLDLPTADNGFVYKPDGTPMLDYSLMTPEQCRFLMNERQENVADANAKINGDVTEAQAPEFVQQSAEELAKQNQGIFSDTPVTEETVQQYMENKPIGTKPAQPGEYVPIRRGVHTQVTHPEILQQKPTFSQPAPVEPDEPPEWAAERAKKQQEKEQYWKTVGEGLRLGPTGKF